MNRLFNDIIAGVLSLRFITALVVSSAMTALVTAPMAYQALEFRRGASEEPAAALRGAIVSGANETAPAPAPAPAPPPAEAPAANPPAPAEAPADTAVEAPATSAAPAPAPRLAPAAPRADASAPATAAPAESAPAPEPAPEASTSPAPAPPTTASSAPPAPGEILPGIGASPCTGSARELSAAAAQQPCDLSTQPR